MDGVDLHDNNAEEKLKLQDMAKCGNSGLLKFAMALYLKLFLAYLILATI